MWGLPIVALTLVIHAIGLVLIAWVLRRAEAMIEVRRWRHSETLIASMLLIGGAGGMLTVCTG